MNDSNNKRQLLREYIELCPGGICKDFLTEQEKHDVNNGAIILTGVVQRANTVNGNGRIYPKKVLEREINKFMTLVRENRALGELDHSDSEIVELKKVSHLITDLWWEGDALYGKIRVLDKVPNGATLKGLIESGVKLGISSRALGSLTEDKRGQKIVNEDLSWVTLDVVSEPSTPQAFLYPETQRNIYETKETKVKSLLSEILNKR